MSVRIDASADGMKRTAGLPSPVLLTVCGWSWQVAAQADATLFSIHDNPGNGNYLQTDSSGRLILSSNLASGAFFASPGTGAWFWWALAISNTLITAYYAALGTMALTTATRTSQNTSVTQMWIGSDGFAEWFSGRFACIKIWDDTLSQAELEAERWAIRPQRFANLHLWSPGWPGASERLLDYSGNGKNWTATGTLTDEDPPPVSYGGAFWSLPAAAAGAGPQTVSLAAAGLTAAPQALTVVPGIATITLAAAGLAAGPQALTVVPGAATLLLSAAALAASPQTLTVVPGAVALAFAAATLTAAPQGLVASTPETISLASAALAAGAQSLSVVPGSVTITVTAAALAASPQPIAAGGLTVVSVAAATLASAAQSLTLVPGAVSPALTAAGLLAAPQPLAIVPGAVSASLAAAALLAGSQTVTLVPGQALVNLTPATLAAAAQQIDVGAGAVAILLAAAALAAQGQALVFVGDANALNVVYPLLASVLGAATSVTLGNDHTRAIVAPASTRAVIE